MLRSTASFFPKRWLAERGTILTELPKEAQAERDDEMERIVGEEQRVLSRVLRQALVPNFRRPARVDYDIDLISLRDQIAEARLEDVAPLVAQMERLQQIAARRAEVVDGQIDIGSPYFGRIVLLESERKREVLIGRSTFLDPRTGVQIVDWRDAPVSRVYYRYDEGDDYDEVFGGRLVEGEVLTRRSLAISASELRRVAASQGTFLRRKGDQWVRLGDGSQLHGGQGSAPRPSSYKPVGKLGIEHDGAAREDKYLPEIAALIDSRQFELITKPSSGLIVIQGGAGSGKTTIGLHRLAFLAFHDPQRFRPDRMLIVVFNHALARYIAFVLPALGVPGISVTTFHDWARKLRRGHVPKLPSSYTDDTPDVVMRLKKHPAWLRIIDDQVQLLEAGVAMRLGDMAPDESEAMLVGFRPGGGLALAERARQWLAWLSDLASVSPAARHLAEREARLLVERANVIGMWSELLTDKPLLLEQFERYAPGEFTTGQIDSAHRWCTARCTAILAELDEREEQRAEQAAGEEQEQDEMAYGIDGREERTSTSLDWEDDALILRMHQRLQGALRRGKDALAYEHVFVDEAQDLSPLELALVLGTARSDSVTLAGDVAQRLLLDNGFSSWKSVLDLLGLDHVKVEPLRVSYRSTQEILEFSNHALGHLQNEEPGRATRQGMPVELFRFAHTGEAVGFLANSLRALCASEPLASIAVIARSPEQAAEYAEGLRHAEVPNLRLIAEQDFPFKAGVDVTDIRQVKGLEFDYVVLVEVTAGSYPDDDESRHLLHIGASRAAHQLWVMTSDYPSPLLPKELCERGY